MTRARTILLGIALIAVIAGVKPVMAVLERAQLWRAARRGDTLAVRHLLRGGTGCDLRDDFGRTPLMEAAHSGHTEVVRALLEYGASANAVRNDQVGALHLAAGRGHREVVRLLLLAKADPNAASRAGWTPLMHAAMYGDTGTIRLLLHGGADPAPREYTKNKTAEEIAAGGGDGNKSAVKMLRRAMWVR